MQNDLPCMSFLRPLFPCSRDWDSSEPASPKTPGVSPRTFTDDGPVISNSRTRSIWRRVMWLVWWLRWHGARLLVGEWRPFEKGAGQPARVRVKVEQTPG